MKSGLFINNDLLAMGISSGSGKIKFADYFGDKEVFLYFLFNKSKKSQLELCREARTLFYPGNTEILGEYLKFIDSEDDNFNIFGKESNRFEILSNIINTMFSENINLLSEKTEPGTSPFYLILPPYIGNRAKEKIINSIRGNRKIIRETSSLYPYIYYLLTQNEIPAPGTVLFVEMTFSDIYFYLIKTSFNNHKYRIEIIEEDVIRDTKIIFEIIRSISEYLVETSAEKYSPSALGPERKEHEILYNMGDAQDILLELNSVEEWTSIEIEVELSDNKGGPIVVEKDKLQNKVFKAIVDSGLKSKIDHFIKIYQPDKMVMYGDNFNNRFMSDFFDNYKGCEIIKHSTDYYLHIFKAIFGQDEAVDNVKTDELLKGQIITLNNYNEDTNNGRTGPAEHDLKYLGDNKYEVIRSTRGLERGMILKNNGGLWRTGMILEFKVLKAAGFDPDHLKGKSLCFVMRPVRKIELRKWLD